MTIFRLITFRFTPTLVTLLLTLQISACGTEDFLTAIAPDLGSGSEPATEAENNHAAIITGDNTGSLTEDTDTNNQLHISGKLDIIDLNDDEAFFIAKTISGQYGNLEIDTDGNWNYAADNNQSAVQSLNDNETLTDNLIISSIDGTTHTIKITIIGITDEAPNTPALISGNSTGSVTEDANLNNNMLVVAGELVISDPDSNEARFISKTVNGNFGNLNITAAGIWVYAANNDQSSIQNLNNNETLNDNLAISSIDGTTHTIRITIIGATDETPNTPALISGDSSGSVTEDSNLNNNMLEVAGKLVITDPDTNEERFVSKTVSGDFGSLSITTAGNWVYRADNSQSAIQNLANGESLTDNLTINSVDGTSHTITITISGMDESTATGDVTLSWAAPTQREDNSALAINDIARYTIYYGTTSGQHSSQTTTTSDSHTITGLPVGTYYFAITTTDTDGRESQHSTEIAITI